MTVELTTPGPTIGVVGGGQLGRMLGEAAAPLGVELIVLDPTPACPASVVARDQLVGDFDDGDGVRELASRVDVLTYEIELADPDLLESVSERESVPVHPAPETLRFIQDKLVQNQRLADHDVPLPGFVRVDDVADLEAALDRFGSPVMLKARTGGYDGRGNAPVAEGDDLQAAIDDIGGPAIAESFVDFVREVSVIGVIGADDRRTYTVGENVHEAEILRETIVPARTSQTVRDQADAVAADVLDVVDGRGVYGIELFETGDGDILVNEIAPRPHNSGHWTIEGAATSQFENHVRAVLGWPLGSTALERPSVSANVLGDTDRTHSVAKVDGDYALHGVSAVLGEPDVSLHWYGKREVRPLRKMGHVTGTGDDPPVETVTALRDRLTFEPRTP